MPASERAAVLRDREADLLDQLEHLTRPPEDAGSIGFGKRIGDGTPVAVQRMSDVTVHAQLTTLLAQVRAALTRIQDGSYGVCEVCGEQIPAARLEARPWASRCIRHA